MDEIKAINNKFTCVECQNEIVLDPLKKVGDVIECPYCGIEYELTGKDGESVTLQLIEEEK